MSLFGIPREAVAEAGRLDGLHGILRAEGERERAERFAASPEAGRKLRFGWLIQSMDLFTPVFWLLVFLHQAAPALIPGLAAVVVAWPEAPQTLRVVVGCILIVCTLFSVPFLMVSGVGRIDPFLAMRLPSREALFLHRAGGIGTRVLLSGLGWAAAVAICLLDADAPAAAILPLALAAGLLPAAIAVRIAWAKAPDPASEAVDASRRIPSGILAVLLILCIPMFFGDILDYWNSRRSLRWLLLACLLINGPMALITNGGFILGHLRKSTMPKGAWARALRGTGSLLALLAAILGTLILAVGPPGAPAPPRGGGARRGRGARRTHAPPRGAPRAALGGGAPILGAGTFLRLGARGVHLLRDGMRTFAAREVLPMSPGKAAKGGAPGDPAAASRPFPRKARNLLEARHPVFQEFSGTGEKILVVLVLLAALGTLVGFCIAEPKPMILLLAILLLIPWNHLKHRERAWLLGMDLVDQRRHDRLFDALWQGPLLLGLSLLLVPVVGGGAERWALLPWLLGILVLRMGVAGFEALFQRAGFRSLRSRMPIYALVAAVIFAPLGGTPWSLAAAAAGIGLGLLGILLDERLMTETVMKEDMLRKAEGA